ncbi:MAG TPA: hypothetical protein VFP31_08730 [Gaiellaceae bacterium]|nr:hypothetical protein [Gaiellaceae bacterium]
MLATLSWPAAVVIAATILAVALVVSVATWQIFATGREDIRSGASGRP